MHVVPPPDVDAVASALGAERFIQILRSGVDEDPNEYVHWDELRHLEPPGELSHEEWWWLIKVGRRRALRSLPLTDVAGSHFVYGTPDPVLRLLHYVDQRCSGEIAMPEVVTADDQARQHYLINALMEEAIRSSQLEGA